MPLTLDRQNAYRARYAELRPGWLPATTVYETLIRTAIGSAVGTGGAALLDLGCGRGGVLEQLVDVPGLHATGIDPDFASLAEHRLPDLPRAVAGAEAIPLAAACCDMVISAWVLEHLPDPARTFSEVARVLRPGGLFIALAPNRDSPVALLNRVLKPLQNALVPRLYGRAEADTFPVLYRANTRSQVDDLCHASGLTLAAWHAIDDPTYLAFNPALFHLSVLLTRLLPASMAVHGIAVCRKP
ncbi:MAG: class I SAM-dependent methyltransferase [Anaerolineae bacterium]|nr:class I SAM-dependent methyltransferase [Anaerolineae bacterium]